MNNKDESLLLIIEYPDHIAVMSSFCMSTDAELKIQRDLKRNIWQMQPFFHPFKASVLELSYSVSIKGEGHFTVYISVLSIYVLPPKLNHVFLSYLLSIGICQHDIPSHQKLLWGNNLMN